jgi:hypothetical protein
MVAAIMISGTFTTMSARGGSLNVIATIDDNIDDNTGSGTFTQVVAATNGLDIRNFAGAAPNFEHRAVIEFLQFTLPANTVVTSVLFNFDAESVTNQQSRIVGVYGYTGSGSITTADATAPATQLTTYDNFALGLGQQSIDLGAAGISLIESLSGSPNPLAIRLQGVAYGVNTQIYSIEQTAFPDITPPSVTINFSSVPEPPSVALLGVGGLVLATYFARRHVTSRVTRSERSSPAQVPA